MLRTRLSVLTLLLALCGSMLVAPGALARQGAECEGIDDYIVAVNATGNPVTAPDETILPEGSIVEWEADELATAVAEMQRIQDELEEIDPPAVAEAFHATLIEAMGALTGLLEAVGEVGIEEAGTAFGEEIESIDTRLSENGLAVEAACQVALLDDDFDGEPEIGEGDMVAFPTVAAATIEAPVEVISSSEPVPAGTAAMLDSQWELTVLSVTPDATEAVLAYDPSNTPPPDGSQYFIVRVKITNTGAEAGSFSNWRLSLLDPSGRIYVPFVDYCGFIEDELTFDTIEPGASAEGNVCWAIPAAEAASTAGLTIYDGDRLPGEGVSFSLDVPDGASTEDTSGGGFADAIGNAGESVVSGFGTPESEDEG